MKLDISCLADGRGAAGIDLGSRELDTEASTRPRDFAWGEAEEPEPEPLTPDSFNKKTKAEPPTFLRPGLFIGSISAERDLQVLKKYGITHVLQVGSACATSLSICMLFLALSGHIQRRP